MGLISRFRNVFRSKANAVLDKMEDPEEQLDYLYEQLLEQKKMAARAIRDATADRNLIRNELDEQRSEMQQDHDKAKVYRAKALKLDQEGAGEDQIAKYNDAAKQLLAGFLSHQKRVEELDERLVKANLSVNTLKEKQIDLDAKIEDLRSRKEQLKSEWRMAEAEERISSSLAGFESDFSDMDLTLGRIEGKIKHKKALAEASSEVMAEQQLSGSLPDLELPSLEAEAALAELDRELTGDPALPGTDTTYFCIAMSGGGTWAIEEQNREKVLEQLNKFDDEITQLNEKNQLTPEKFDEMYAGMFSLIRKQGRLVGRDLTAEDVGASYYQPEVKLPPEDLDFEEAQQVFQGEGLVPNSND